MLFLHVYYNCACFSFCEWVKRCKLGDVMLCSLVCWYVAECFPYFLNFHRKNLVQSSAGSSSVLLGGKGFCVVLPVSLLTKASSVFVFWFKCGRWKFSISIAGFTSLISDFLFHYLEHVLYDIYSGWDESVVWDEVKHLQFSYIYLGDVTSMKIRSSMFPFW